MAALRTLLSDWRILSPIIIVVASQVFILLERLFPYDKGQKVFRRGWFTDFVMYTLVQSYVLGLVIQSFIAWLDGTTGASRLGLVTSWPVYLQLFFFFVTHDLYIYCFHRLQHRSKVLWRTHEAHHSPVEVDWLSGSRSHPIEILVNQTIEYAPIVLLGAKPEVALMKATLDAVWGMYIHSNIDVRSGWLQYVINGPEMHRWHHSKVFTGYGFNYGTKLAIWDWMFGTAYRPAEKPPAYGLPDIEYPVGYFAQLATAFRPFEPSSEGGLEGSDGRGVELDARGLDAVDDALDAASAGDRDDHRALREHPRQDERVRGAPAPRGLGP